MSLLEAIYASHQGGVHSFNFETHDIVTPQVEGTASTPRAHAPEPSPIANCIGSVARRPSCIILTGPSEITSVVCLRLLVESLTLEPWGESASLGTAITTDSDTGSTATTSSRSSSSSSKRAVVIMREEDGGFPASTRFVRHGSIHSTSSSCSSSSSSSSPVSEIDKRVYRVPKDPVNWSPRTLAQIDAMYAPDAEQLRDVLCRGHTLAYRPAVVVLQDLSGIIDPQLALRRPGGGEYGSEGLVRLGVEARYLLDDWLQFYGRSSQHIPPSSNYGSAPIVIISDSYVNERYINCLASCSRGTIRVKCSRAEGGSSSSSSSSARNSRTATDGAGHDRSWDEITVFVEHVDSSSRCELVGKLVPS
jgi:hypothetical protein